MSATTVTQVSAKVGRRPAARIVLRLLIGLFLVSTAFLAVFYFVATSSLPQLDGTITLEGLTAPVQVMRDAQGLPHIRAQNLADLMFAQGYITAQDRLWQMDMTRRYAAGELSEILGPEWIKHDREQRILSLRQAAQRSAGSLNSQEKPLFESYVRGVNAFIESRQGKLSLEFTLLGYSPRPWRLEDSLLVGAQMAQNLSHEQFQNKLLREKLSAALGAQKAADLYPNSSWRDRPPAEPKKNATKPSNKDPDDEDDDESVAETHVAALQSDSSGWVPSFDAEDSREDALVPGSNNWVVSGAHTVSGKPLLSNDMHLHHQIPNVWYEAHLTAGDFDAVGVTLPGLPFIIAGHNRRITWGFTNLGPDVEDVFIESFNARGEYQTPRGWKQPERRHEVIHVKGGPDVHFDVLLTRHGPIAADLMPGETRPIALEWTLHTVGLDFPFRELNQAQNWNEFRHALRRLTIAGQNVVYADVEGHIGYQSTGMVPLRRSGNGALPVSGADDSHEWTGYIPYDEMPAIYDPSWGIVATANGRATPDRYPYSISTEWAAPYRTERIYRVLESRNKFSAADMLALQNDVYSEFDKFCADQFVASLDHSQNASRRAREAGEILRAWDGRMTADSAAATQEREGAQRAPARGAPAGVQLAKLLGRMGKPAEQAAQILASGWI
jgi:penicillin amidase